MIENSTIQMVLSCIHGRLPCNAFVAEALSRKSDVLEKKRGQAAAGILTKGKLLFAKSFPKRSEEQKNVIDILVQRF